MATDRKILQWLENELFDGRLVLGQELPSERRIASAVGVSRGSVHDALKNLEAAGILRLYEGRRRQMIAQLVREPAASAGPALKLHMATAEYPLRDIVHTRVLLETWAVRRADPERPAMQELAAIIEEMDREELSLKDFHHLEVSFHVALTRLAGNTLVTGMLTAMRDSIWEYTMSLVGYVPLWTNTATRLRAEHRAIYEALASGDNELAARMVAEHIEGHYLEAGVDPDRKQRSSASVFVEPETDEAGNVLPLDSESRLAENVADSVRSDADLSDGAPGPDHGLTSVQDEEADGDCPDEPGEHDAEEAASVEQSVAKESAEKERVEKNAGQKAPAPKRSGKKARARARS